MVLSKKWRYYIVGPFPYMQMQYFMYGLMMQYLMYIGDPYIMYVVENGKDFIAKQREVK
jgi:hypothetical protein